MAGGSEWNGSKNHTRMKMSLYVSSTKRGLKLLSLNEIETVVEPSSGRVSKIILPSSFDRKIL